MFNWNVSELQSSEFKYNKQLFMEKARKWTQEHAFQKNKVSLLSFWCSFHVKPSFHFSIYCFCYLFIFLYSSVSSAVLSCEVAFFIHKMVLWSFRTMLYIVFIWPPKLTLLFSKIKMGCSGNNQESTLLVSLFKGAMDDAKENIPEQKASSRKRDPLTAHQGGETAKRFCM